MVARYSGFFRVEESDFVAPCCEGPCSSASKNPANALRERKTGQTRLFVKRLTIDGKR
jgi:hypothetical protein